MEQGIDGLAGEKADKGATGESGLNVRSVFRCIIAFTIMVIINKIYYL